MPVLLSVSDTGASVWLAKRICSNTGYTKICLDITRVHYRFFAAQMLGQKVVGFTVTSTAVTMIFNP